MHIQMFMIITCNACALNMHWEDDDHDDAIIILIHMMMMMMMMMMIKNLKVDVLIISTVRRC